MSEPPSRLAVIGGGAMAEAIVLGGVRAGVLRPRAVGIADPSADRRALFAEHAIETFEPGADVVNWATDGASPARLLLAVKPQMLDDVATQIAPTLRASGRVVIASILAGVPIEALRAKLGDAHAYVRLMPNTPALVGKGLTAWAPAEDAEASEGAALRALFESLGEVIDLDESMIDAFTGVAGSGPAYLFYLAEAMARGAEDVGFDAETARRLADGTITGAAALLEASSDDAATLRARVTSRKGTTAAAIERLDAGAVMDTVREAIVAARDRGRELGSG